jgi:hypothetical protein
MYADWLLNESRWSRTAYSYQKAALLCMLGNDLTLDEKAEIENLMRCSYIFLSVCLITKRLSRSRCGGL